MAEDSQRKLAAQLAESWRDVPIGRRPDWRYHPDNDMFVLSDAAVLHAVLRHVRPKRYVEVGSGFSSAMAMDTADRHLPGLEFTFIEPHPERLLGLLGAADRERSTLIRSCVQDVPLDVFRRLAPDDVLFIDSTHVAKAGSDLNWLLFDVLPALAPGVVVHFHDVFWPFEYPDSWLNEKRAWNEVYMLRAYLSYNSAVRMMLFNSWLWQAEPELVRDALPHAADQRPGSLWLKVS
ncbi:class I SAM-dependent methyltransferase [Streptomyces sp. NPDC004546]|uniref:class I SAM-dependent methyltransferase n=1 Tax=unclassified Streptomyces TaxID=2593676 RepID=UPI0033BD563D